MNYGERDNFGMYSLVTALDDTAPNRGPGPHLMGTDALLCNEVVNAQKGHPMPQTAHIVGKVEYRSSDGPVRVKV